MSTIEISLIIGVLANLATTISVGAAIIRRIEEHAQWRGRIDTTVGSNKIRIDNHGARLGVVEAWQARHEGESTPRGS